MIIEVTDEMIEDYDYAKFYPGDESYLIRLGQELFEAIKQREES